MIEKKICFAASSGGHFEQIMMLEPLMDKYECFIVTEKTKYHVNSKGHQIYYMHQINRKQYLHTLWMALNSLKSILIFIKERPDIVITTGVLAMIPLCLFAKMMRRKLVYIESFAKISTPTATGKFLYRYADRFYVQWKDMLTYYPHAIFLGGIY